MSVDIYRYVDARRFLHDWFQARKQANPRLSHRWFARKVGTTDPNVLRNLITGRRNLGHDRIATFAHALDLDDDEARYFELLIAHTQAVDTAARARARAQLDALRADVAPPLSDQPLILQYASTWRHAAVRELIRCTTPLADPAPLAARFDPPVSPAEVSASIEVLLGLGLVELVGGRLHAGSDEVLATAPTVPLQATRTYHHQTDVLARRALARVDELEDVTFFVGQTLSIPRARLKELTRRIWEAFHHVATDAETWPNPDQVVQLNVRLFPLTDVPSAEAPTLP